MSRSLWQSGDAESRLLRRVDWRFFLADLPSRVVCDAGPELTAAVRTIWPEANPLDEDTRLRDLAVLSNPTTRLLRRARSALAPNGTCYIEWDRQTILGHRRRHAQLRAAGLEPIESYWAWPPPARESPQFWLPHHGEGAISYFLATRPLARTPTRRVLRSASRMAWRAVRRLGILAPTCTIARRSSDNERRTPLEDELKRRWAEWGLGPAPRALSCIMLTGGHSRLNKVVVLAFTDDATTPRLALKLARVPEAESALAREAQALSSIASENVRVLADVPRVVFNEPLGESYAVGETPTTGIPITWFLSRDTHRALALEVVQVLATMATGRLVDPPTYWDRIVEPRLADFGKRFGRLIDHRALQDTRRELASLPMLPVTIEHGDCAPANVLRATDKRLALLDWESAEPAGLPVLDAVHYLAHATFFVEGTLASGRERSTYAEMLQPTTPTGQVFSEAMELYCASIGIDSNVVPVLRQFTWILNAAGEHDYIMSLQPESPPDDAARQSVFLALWLEDVESSRLTR